MRGWKSEVRNQKLEGRSPRSEARSWEEMRFRQGWFQRDSMIRTGVGGLLGGSRAARPVTALHVSPRGLLPCSVRLRIGSRRGASSERVRERLSGTRDGGIAQQLSPNPSLQGRIDSIWARGTSTRIPQETERLAREARLRWKAATSQFVQKVWLLGWPQPAARQPGQLLVAV